MMPPEYFYIGNGLVSQDSVHMIFHSHRFFNVGEVLFQLQRFIRNDIIRIKGVPAQVAYMENIMNTL